MEKWHEYESRLLTTQRWEKVAKKKSRKKVREFTQIKRVLENDGFIGKKRERA